MVAENVARVGSIAPDFKGTAVMADGEFKEISLADYKGKYVVLFFYPLDFTFVCPSEIVAFDNAIDEFNKRNCQIIGCSVDSHFTHFAYRNTALNDGGIGFIKYPLLSDLNHNISKSYGVHLDNPGVALRGLFLIDKDGIIRSIVINDLPLGRNVLETIRVLDALQFHEEHGEVCPANWKKGDPGMKSSADGVKSYMASMASRHD